MQTPYVFYHGVRKRVGRNRLAKGYDPLRGVWTHSKKKPKK